MRLEVGSEDWGAAERKPARLEGTFSPGHHQRHPPYNLRYSPTNHGTDFCGQQRWARIEPERRGHRHRCRHYSGRPESQLRPSDLVCAAVAPVPVARCPYGGCLVTKPPGLARSGHLVGRSGTPSGRARVHPRSRSRLPAGPTSSGRRALLTSTRSSIRVRIENEVPAMVPADVRRETLS